MCGTENQSLPMAQSAAGCSCCSPQPGGNAELPDAREPGRSTTTEFLVEGMTCGHCSSGVSSELSRIAGVNDVRVSLVPGGASKVTVFGSGPVSRDAARAAVREAGYELAGN